MVSVFKDNLFSREFEAQNNVLADKYYEVPEVYLEPCQTSTMERSAKITKRSILDIWQGSETPLRSITSFGTIMNPSSTLKPLS